MHIADGVLSTNVMAATNVAAVAAVGLGLRRIDYAQVPRVGVLAAVFFVGSLIHIKIGPASVHLLLNGLVGFMLGWAALPAMAAALFLQAILFGYGGLTVLGANTLIMALPAVLCHALYAARCRTAAGERGAFAWGMAAGATAVTGSCLLMAAALFVSRADTYSAAIKALLAFHVPVIGVESVVVGAMAAFLHKVQPELLQAPVREREDED